MAKGQKRSSREVRKPKQAPAPAKPTSSLFANSGKPGNNRAPGKYKG